MKINPFVYGVLILVVFLGGLGIAQASGWWSISGKVTASGEKVTPSGTDVAEIKGWMTLNDISTAYKVPVEEIIKAFDLPLDTPATTQVKSLESEKFSVTNLRTWLAARPK
jgi:hypothetical protein